MRRKIFIAGVLSVIFWASFAQAVAFVEFNDRYVSGGMLTDIGGRIIGSGIKVGNVVVWSEPWGDIPWAEYSSDAVLNFDTGSNNNFIRITGGIPAMNIPEDSILVEGTLTNWYVTNREFELVLNGMSGPVVLMPELLAYLNITPDVAHLHSGIIYSYGGGNDTFAVVEAYINTHVGAEIPEPMSLFLLGSGLIGLAGYGRRKFFKK